ncbi:glycosyltransferase [Burkholderia sp. SIMBA_062]|uniref:glycosyltransferase n=1 Tax=Burkholderia sp. SIMBA_062 TaxID=3085803 RepID=UPI0039799E80
MNTLALYVPLIVLWLRTVMNITWLVRLARETSYRISRDAKAPRASNGGARLFIVTPALNEQNHIGDYLAHICERLASHAGLVERMVVVCNDSEAGDSSSTSGLHTWDAAMRALGASGASAISSTVDVIRYSGEARRSGQINFACAYLRRNHGLASNDFVLLLDVDAILDDNFFCAVADHVECSRADLAQVQSIYLSAANGSHYDAAAALWQNYFMLSRERARFIRRERLNEDDLTLNGYFWYTANGVVIRYSLIEAVGGFVESCAIDDLSTSGMFCAAGCRVALLDTFLSVEQAPGSTADFKQKLFWCSSYVEMFRMLGSRMLGGNAGIGYILFRISHFVVWILRAPVILGSAIACGMDYRLVGACALSYLAYLASSYAFPFVFLPRTRRSLRVGSPRGLLCLAIYPLVQSLVPWLMVAKRGALRLCGSSVMGLPKKSAGV